MIPIKETKLGEVQRSVVQQSKPVPSLSKITVTFCKSCKFGQSERKVDSTSHRKHQILFAFLSQTHCCSTGENQQKPDEPAQSQTEKKNKINFN